MKLKQQFEKHLGSNWILAGLHRGCTVQSRSSLHSRYIVSGSSVNAQSFLWWLKTFGGVVVAGEKTMHTLFLKKKCRVMVSFTPFFSCPYLNEIQYLSETSSFSKGTSFPCRCLPNFSRQTGGCPVWNCCYPLQNVSSITAKKQGVIYLLIILSYKTKQKKPPITYLQLIVLTGIRPYSTIA